MKHLLLTWFLGWATLTGMFCQSPDPPQKVSGDLLSRLEDPATTAGKVKITMDPGIEENYYKDLIYNQQHPGIQGYRIRIFTGSGVGAYDQARKVRARFLSDFDDVDAYIEYDAPDYKVYVGDCRTRSEVQRLFYRIKPEFPNSFPVSHTILEDNDK